ncbi:DUF411 domain-containing protein [Haliea salexigens]|uniref:DUF411 domain-containing protein n=1 Tax=Haliea salexigens TaxID=287487 RepID=UPI0003F571C9|nr:DUF411 domain-containing protein [Haliea salexigens]
MELLSTGKGVFLSLMVSMLLAACNAESDAPSTENSPAASTSQALTVYKQPTCGCCKKWMSHIEEAGIDVTGRHMTSMTAVKDRYQIEPRYQSCHTATSSQGYVFEGHIPARYIKAFLANPPDGAIGLAVPGMPVGSPGMEVENRFTPYQVLLLRNDGGHEVYATIETAAQQ